MTESEADLAAADWVLALIPVTLLAGLLAGLVASLSLPLAAGVGSLPASGLVGYALFCTEPATRALGYEQ